MSVCELVCVVCVCERECVFKCGVCVYVYVCSHVTCCPDAVQPEIMMFQRLSLHLSSCDRKYIVCAS